MANRAKIQIRNRSNRWLKSKMLLMWACQEAREWVGKRDLKTAFEECTRGDWIAWFLDAASVHSLRGFPVLRCIPEWGELMTWWDHRVDLEETRNPSTLEDTPQYKADRRTLARKIREVFEIVD